MVGGGRLPMSIWVAIFRPAAASEESSPTARQSAKNCAVVTRFFLPSWTVTGIRAWLSTAAGVSPILVSPIQKAFAALKRSGTLTVIFPSLLSFALTWPWHFATFPGLADDRFGLQILLQSEDPAFPTNSRLFEPAEGSKRIVAYCIDEDPAGSKFARHTVRTFRVGRAYVSDEPEFRVIGDFNSFGFRLVRQYRQDRSENLFLRDPHVACDVGEHGGFDEISILKPGRMTFPADNEFRAFLDARLDVFLNALILLYAGQGAESHILVSWIADLDLFDGRSHQSLHFAQPVFRHDQARSRDAGLTVVQVTGCDCHRDGSGEIGVVQNDVRRLAAEFQRQALHRVQGVLRDQFSDLRRTGERDLLNVGTFRQLRPDDLTEAGHEIDNARRQTGFMKSVHQHFRLHRAHLAGLDDNGASGSDCRSHLDRDRTGARIPRRKYAHHARRFHDNFGSPDSSCQIEVLENFFEVQENISREAVRALRAVLRSAVFQNRRVNELIHSLGNRFMQPLQAVHAVFIAALRKGIKRLLGRGDGLSGVDLIRHGDLADNRVVGRVHQVNDLGSMGCDELAVDVGAIKGSYRTWDFVFVHLRLPF